MVWGATHAPQEAREWRPKKPRQERDGRVTLLAVRSAVIKCKNGVVTDFDIKHSDDDSPYWACKPAMSTGVGGRHGDVIRSNNLIKC